MASVTIMASGLVASVTFGKRFMASVIMAELFIVKVLW